MSFSATWLPHLFAYLGWLVLAALLCATARRAWQDLTQRQAAVGISLLMMVVLWSLQAGLNGGQLAGMNYHLLGISLATLMLGAPASLWLCALLMLPYTYFSHREGSLLYCSINILLLALPSITMNTLFRRLTQHLPRNIFVYIFINGFICAALSMLCTGLLIIATLQIAHAYPAALLWGSAFPVFFLLTWGEAFFSGIFTAIFVALAPQLLATYDDTLYLKQHNQIWKP